MNYWHIAIPASAFLLVWLLLLMYAIGHYYGWEKGERHGRNIGQRQGRLAERRDNQVAQRLGGVL